ncbi:MAG: DUF2520 domain-containing protein [Firmicutes bacterium]|nr:DUF2520 domain-containing protein [Bacillota bacterium]
MNKPSIAIVGAGKVGSALAVALQKADYPIVGIASRSLQSAQKLGLRLQVDYSDQPAQIVTKAKTVFITTPDREITKTTVSIAAAGGFKEGQVVVHTSGVLSSKAIIIAAEHGASIAAFHPLQSFADIDTAINNLPGSYFALDGDAVALKTLEPILNDLQGKGITINAKDKPLYHAAAVVASNYLVTILHLATEMLSKLGMDQKQAAEALFPLIQGTINNIKNKGTANALTGPIERGDKETMQKHLDKLALFDLEEQQAYKALGAMTVKIALEKGSIDEDTAYQLINTLEVSNHE